MSSHRRSLFYLPLSCFCLHKHKPVSSSSWLMQWILKIFINISLNLCFMHSVASPSCSCCRWPMFTRKLEIFFSVKLQKVHKNWFQYFPLVPHTKINTTGYNNERHSRRKKSQWSLWLFFYNSRDNHIHTN